MASACTSVEAPELKRAASRVNWLVRQLRNAPAGLRVDVTFYRTRETSSELLAKVRESLKCVLLGSDRVPRSFALTLSTGVGTKRRSGQGSFIGDVSALLDQFYREVVQDLKPWTAPAPQLEPTQSGAGEEEEVMAEGASDDGA